MCQKKVAETVETKCMALLLKIGWLPSMGDGLPVDNDKT
jgi:hypothetical protein